MKVVLTATEAITYGYWENICNLQGINIWAVNEGLMDGDEEIELTIEEALKLGIIKEV